MSCFPEQCSPSKEALLLTGFLNAVSVLDLHIGLGTEPNGVLLKEGSGLLYANRARADGTQRIADSRNYYMGKLDEDVCIGAV